MTDQADQTATHLLARTIHTQSGASLSGLDFGAHLIDWQSASGKKWLYLSPLAERHPNKAIRGGVPVIFPQFNAFGSGPRHGFARTTMWRTSKTTTPNQLCWELTNYDVCDTAWPFYFHAALSATLTDSALDICLNVENTGETDFNFTAALHTYFAISDLKQTRLSGLQGLDFWDNDGSDFANRQKQTDDVLVFQDAIDRVYFNQRNRLFLQDGDHQLTISQPGFADTVVWNPGQAAAANMSDLPDEDYQHMLCVEAAAIDVPIELAPGEAWQGKQTLQES